MALPAPPPLPTRFPCWCRAVYSWGGESKRDLGFMEGDLIECLNAGDGSWWTGRLRRDRRMVGAFPSNFVEVLPEDFRPVTRSVSPLPPPGSSGSGNSPSPNSKPQKSKTFRKPFEAYAKAPHYTTAKQPETYQPGSQRSRESLTAEQNQNQNQNLQTRIPVRANSSTVVPPHPQSYVSRAPSPIPPPPQSQSMGHLYRAHSPAPPMNTFRGPSPAPPMALAHPYRAASPAPPINQYRAASPAPPMNQYRAVSPAPPPMNQYRAASPAPPMGYRAVSPAPAPMQDYGGMGMGMGMDRGMRAASPAPLSYHRAVSPAPPPQSYHRAASPAPPMNGYDYHRAVSPAPPRPPSAQPTYDYRAVSPMPAPMHYSNNSLGSFQPAPPAPQAPPAERAYQPYRRSDVDVAVPEGLDSPPPPAPPPHRHAMTGSHDSTGSFDPQMGGLSRQGSNMSHMSHVSNVSHLSYRSQGAGPSGGGGAGFQTPRRGPSPCPPSPGVVGLDDGRGDGRHSTGMTPSPLREAMDGVMEQLGVLGMKDEFDDAENGEDLGMEETPRRRPDAAAAAQGGADFDPWSPDSFATLHQQSRRKQQQQQQQQQRPRPFMASHSASVVDEGYETYSGSGQSSAQEYGSAKPSKTAAGFREDEQQLPQLSNYVERMESRLRSMHEQQQQQQQQQQHGKPQRKHDDQGPTPPPKGPIGALYDRPKSSMGGFMGRMGRTDTQGSLGEPDYDVDKANDVIDTNDANDGSNGQRSAAEQKLRHRRSAYDVGRQMLSRTFTTKTNGTNSTSTTNTSSSTERSLMSGVSAGGISATSAGSLARKNMLLNSGGRARAQSALGLREWGDDGAAPGQSLGMHGGLDSRPDSPFTGVTYHSSHASDYVPGRPKSQMGFGTSFSSGRATPAGLSSPDMGGLSSIGGLTQPKAMTMTSKRASFFKKIVESAKAGVASSRGSIAMSGFGGATTGTMGSSGMHGMGSSTGVGGAGLGIDAGLSRDMGLGVGAGSDGVDWVQVRRDVNRSNSLSRNERSERRDRCQMLDYPAVASVDELFAALEGDEGADGMPVAQPTDYAVLNLAQVDKNTRFIGNLPAMTTAITLATTYVCRPYRSDVQRLRAIFTWVAEKVAWEEEYEGSPADGEGAGSGGVDTRRVIETKRGCAREYAGLVREMCAAAGLACEVVRGYLKGPEDVVELGLMPRANHWWNAVVVDGEWRIMDCCVASASFPRRSHYSSGGFGGYGASGGAAGLAGGLTGGLGGGLAGGAADGWWFLARPSEACFTHIPDHHAQQHLCPPVAHEVLLNLPCAGPAYFRHGLHLADYDTSLLRIEDLEMVQLRVAVPDDVELAAEIEVRALARDADGDLFETGDVVRKRALAQADWVGGGCKRFTVKAVMPSSEDAASRRGVSAGAAGAVGSAYHNTGILKVYAGKRGLMHSVKDIPHPLAFAVPIVHTGENNPPYDFVVRHPTPHAQRHDIYVVQPQCQRLALNNTFVFAIRQHPSSLGAAAGAGGMAHGTGAGDLLARPASAMSMSSSALGSASGSSVSGSNASGLVAGKKPAKLAIQTPGGKILRLMRKEERRGMGAGGAGGIGVGGGRTHEEEASDGGTWETIIKCSERGVWRGLVLADRTARWCVFAEWVCQ